VRSREDVLLALDKVIRYYEGNEPSSPIPLLIRRARRLVAKGFVDIVKDLMPGAVTEIETIGGESYSAKPADSS
jgi:type VI secretion system protein ImpA